LPTRGGSQPDTNRLNDTEVYLVDYQSATTAKLAKTETTQSSIHKIKIKQRQGSLIIFASSSDDATLSGTPLITASGDVIGIKISDTEAVDIDAVTQILEADNLTDKPFKQQQAQA